MWATAPMPYYFEYQDPKPKVTASRKETSSQSAARPLTSGSTATASVSASSAASLSADMAAGLLDPAIDGPPSPERLRALNKQMKQANLDKSRSRLPSASISSHNPSDRPWEQALDTVTLSRRSSGRSTSSSMPSRERPDSVQLFGKTIFGRKGRLKRDSSANSSSASSLYSGETSLDTAPPAAKEHTKSGIFGRRKPAKSDPFRDASPTPVALKKQSISGPYNFQHVTHTPRDHRMGSVTEIPMLQPPLNPADDSRFPDLPPESNYATEHLMGVPSNVEPHTRIYLDRPRTQTVHALSRSGPRRLIKPSKSQDQIRVPPPRPPRPLRSPILEAYEPQHVTAAPVPPPRLSSRQSIKYGGYDPLETTTLDRPQTSGGFRQPEPFHFAPESSPPPSTAHAHTMSADSGVLPDFSFHHAMTTPDDEAWPLTPTTTATTSTTHDGALPDVPEEEEAPRATQRSRGSVISTSSSIRRSQSVPQLRGSVPHAEISDSAERPPSTGSDTLGGFDLFAAQQALRESAQSPGEMDALSRSSWEDDIDYCYEHELEADCDYEWTQPSDETCRDGPETTPYLTLSESPPSPTQAGAPEPMTRLLLTPDNDDVPALSPASQVSLREPEAPTPTVTALPAVSGFSAGRPGTGLFIKSQRPVSTASSFKECHGFTLSPSLLIPADYQQQMMLTASESVYDDGGPLVLEGYRHYDDQPTAASRPGAADRISTSTLGTESSGRSASTTAGRHESTSTAFTRFTGDDEWSPKAEAPASQTECTFVETLIPGPPGDFAPEEGQGELGLGIGRPRAKTTSLATPQPRAMFSLFPRSPSVKRV